MRDCNIWRLQYPGYRYLGVHLYFCKNGVSGGHILLSLWTNRFLYLSVGTAVEWPFLQNTGIAYRQDWKDICLFAIKNCTRFNCLEALSLGDWSWVSSWHFCILFIRSFSYCFTLFMFLADRISSCSKLVMIIQLSWNVTLFVDLEVIINKGPNTWNRQNK